MTATDWQKEAGRRLLAELYAHDSTAVERLGRGPYCDYCFCTLDHHNNNEAGGGCTSCGDCEGWQ